MGVGQSLPPRLLSWKIWWRDHLGCLWLRKIPNILVQPRAKIQRAMLRHSRYKLGAKNGEGRKQSFFRPGMKCQSFIEMLTSVLIRRHINYTKKCGETNKCTKLPLHLCQMLHWVIFYFYIHLLHINFYLVYMH